MSKNLTEVDEYTANVTVPEGGDARTAASVETPFQALANRTLNHKNRLDQHDTDIAAVPRPVRVQQRLGAGTTASAKALSAGAGWEDIDSLTLSGLEANDVVFVTARFRAAVVSASNIFASFRLTQHPSGGSESLLGVVESVRCSENAGENHHVTLTAAFQVGSNVNNTITLQGDQVTASPPSVEVIDTYVIEAIVFRGVTFSSSQSA
jgi:hypothetical protein